ncbi:MAG: excinuclease ABC subunit UvrA, partial [Bacteroidia bacterium]
KPIGRTPRSNPATYTGVFTDIRNLFAALPEAKVLGFNPGRFSFNVKGGRCEACGGAGVNVIEMKFLPDVLVGCTVCRGKRYVKDTLQVKYKGKSIADILDATISEAAHIFEAQPHIYNKLNALVAVGLGYVKLGQPATTLSGGEAQRIKLASELARKSTGKTVYILDEPSTGLHFEDIRQLLTVLYRFIETGNTVIVIEHNTDIIAAADYIIDLGPEGGKRGGYILFEGVLTDLLKLKNNPTAVALKSDFKGF